MNTQILDVPELNGHSRHLNIYGGDIISGSDYMYGLMHQLHADTNPDLYRNILAAFDEIQQVIMGLFTHGGVFYPGTGFYHVGLDLVPESFQPIHSPAVFPKRMPGFAQIPRNTSYVVMQSHLIDRVYSHKGLHAALAIEGVATWHQLQQPLVALLNQIYLEHGISVEPQIPSAWDFAKATIYDMLAMHAMVEQQEA